jgi:PAS domain S-box-containing protein
MSTARSIQPPLFERQVPVAPEREALVRALAESEARLQRLVHRLSEGVFRAAASGRFVEVNPALVRMLGYATDGDLRAVAVLGDLFVEPMDWERLRPRSGRAQLDRTSVRWKRNDGTCLTLRLSLRAILDEQGRVAWYDGIVDDPTERMRQQELMRRTERMACLGATLAGVAHELNNPLAAILGFAQLLLKKDIDSEMRMALETINHESARAGKIVRDLLTLARKREVERRVRVNLNEVVTYILGTRRYALETHGIQCVTSLDPKIRPVVGDRAQLEQVVLNLLNNAEQAVRSASEHGGRVRIETRPEGSYSVIEIEDDGPGIPDESREHIWDPFWTTKGTGAGTGLGLTVVRDIIASHGGEIDVTPPADGGARGARFVVRLPGLCLQDTLAGEVLGETANRALDVLVIDPDAQSTGFLSAFLASRGHAALASHDLEYALRLAGHLRFDAVICDSSIAQGTATLEALRAAMGCVEARFIIAAGDAPSTARLPFPLPGAAALVMRPYDLEELRVLLED